MSPHTQFQIISTCNCGRQLTTTVLHTKVELPFLAEAQIVCGSCQAVYRVLVHEESEHTT